MALRPDQFVLETDSPYLLPPGHELNCLWYVGLLAIEIGKVCELPPQVVLGMSGLVACRFWGLLF